MFKFVVVKGKPDSERKSCIDCFYLRGAVTLWCTNKEAFKYNGSKIPDYYNCKFWKPMKMKKDLKFWERIFPDYIEANLDG